MVYFNKYLIFTPLFSSELQWGWVPASEITYFSNLIVLTRDAVEIFKTKLQNPSLINLNFNVPYSLKLGPEVVLFVFYMWTAKQGLGILRVEKQGLDRTVTVAAEKL